MRVLSSLFLSILLLTLTVEQAQADKITQDYQEIEFETLKITPEKYDKKKVVYSAQYQNYSTTFPTYMDKSGLSSKKQLLVTIGDFRIPAVCDKTDTMVEFIGKLERGSIVKVYGKVRKFRADPKAAKGMAPEYYVEVEKIELVEKPKDGNKDDGQDNRDPKRPRLPRIRK